MLITGKNKHEIIGIVSFHDILEALVGSFKEDNS
jgi:CBS domain containing-hemolysin-like protein